VRRVSREISLCVGLDGRAELARLEHAIPLCSDESYRTLADLDRLDWKYEAIDIELNNAGGLTEALALASLRQTGKS
jgi:L-alanine-DL-glutamate epimerase-like enolase superfamily enzyme